MEEKVTNMHTYLNGISCQPCLRLILIRSKVV